jgi:hypothetical protein
VDQAYTVQGDSEYVRARIIEVIGARNGAVAAQDQGRVAATFKAGVLGGRLHQLDCRFAQASPGFVTLTIGADGARAAEAGSEVLRQLCSWGATSPTLPSDAGRAAVAAAVAAMSMPAPTPIAAPAFAPQPPSLAAPTVVTGAPRATMPPPPPPYIVWPVLVPIEAAQPAPVAPPAPAPAASETIFEVREPILSAGLRGEGFAPAHIALFDEADRFVVGRDATVADLGVADPRASRRHFAIFSQDGVPMVQDLASMNGTFVNEVKIAEAVALKEGDVVRMGRSKLVFSLDDASPS